MWNTCLFVPLVGALGWSVAITSSVAPSFDGGAMRRDWLTRAGGGGTGGGEVRLGSSM